MCSSFRLFLFFNIRSNSGRDVITCMYMYGILPHGAVTQTWAGKQAEKTPPSSFLTCRAAESRAVTAWSFSWETQTQTSSQQQVAAHWGQHEKSLLLKLTAAGPPPWLWNWVGAGLNDRTGGQTLVIKKKTLHNNIKYLNVRRKMLETTHQVKSWWLWPWQMSSREEEVVQRTNLPREGATSPQTSRPNVEGEKKHRSVLRVCWYFCEV